MNVVAFPSRAGLRGWRRREVNAVLSACADDLKAGAVSGFDEGATEAGDPQLYLLGPEPDRDCIMCISRIGRVYVIEDGEGRILYENDAFGLLTDQVRGALRHKKAAITSRILVAWLAIKETFEERIEPVLGEPAEVLAHISPQLAALV
jgi:hypothetical protein